MKRGYPRELAWCGFFLLAAATPLATRASIVVGGSALLSPTYADQLESWLGEGPITLTNIYTKQAGDTAADFHAAVDGMGRTIVVLAINAGNVSGYYTVSGGTTINGFDNIPYQIIGGYNPLSWDSHSHYHETPNLADRTAFLFNLTSGEIQEQNSGFGGQYQTFNYSGYGPAFGGGHDLFVSTNLASGYAYNYSYGGTSGFNNIINSPEDGTDTNWPFHYNLSIGDLEVFTISNGVPGVVPEAQSAFIWLLLGLTLFGGFSWKRTGPFCTR